MSVKSDNSYDIVSVAPQSNIHGPLGKTWNLCAYQQRSLHSFNIIECDPFPLFWVRHVWRGQRSLQSFSDLNAIRNPSASVFGELWRLEPWVLQRWQQKGCRSARLHKSDTKSSFGYK
nr:hypothetical protein [Tanacetum cinerariifolium]